MSHYLTRSSSESPDEVLPVTQHYTSAVSLSILLPIEVQSSNALTHCEKRPLKFISFFVLKKKLLNFTRELNSKRKTDTSAVKNTFKKTALLFGDFTPDFRGK